MSLPTLEQYGEAVQNPGHAFFDPELRSGNVKKNMLGLPFAVCGGFALTYNISCGAHKYAVRCFHKESKNIGARYAAISKKLASLRSDYFVDFQFQSRGISVQGDFYPVVKMKWAAGTTIGEFLEANFDKKDRIENLKKSLHSLSTFLEKQHISHGDIQPGNLMVDDEGRRIQLIDYDGMYLPEINNLGAEEVGHRNFQHPRRIQLKPWNDRLDRFAFIMLSVALSVLEDNPEIWKNTRSDGDKFLFSANDYISPGHSPLFSSLSKNAQLKELISRFSSVCQANFDTIPTLDEFLNNSLEIDLAVSPASGSLKYISTYPVLDALDYASCLDHVGDIVELVGRVEQVKSGKTHFGSPYYFINFSDWRGNAVKITVWSNSLDKYRHINFKSLTGKYVSVIGLLEPPFTKSTKNYSYTHLSVTLGPTTSFNQIDEAEAKYRLNYDKGDYCQNREKAEESPRLMHSPVCPEQLNAASTTDVNVSDQARKSFFEFDCSTGKLQATCANGSSAASGSRATLPANRTNRDIVEDIKRNAPLNKKIIVCPQCNKKLRVDASGFLEVYCPCCHAVFAYDNFPGKINSRYPPPSRAGQISASILTACPYCSAWNPISNGKGIITAICWSCRLAFDYSHFSHKASAIAARKNSGQGIHNKTHSSYPGQVNFQQASQKSASNPYCWILAIIGFTIFYLLIK